MASASIFLDIIGRDRASDKFDRVAKSADKSSGRLGKFAGAAKSAAKTGMFALGTGAVAAGAGLFKATQMAGDLNETISKTGRLFGKKAAGQLLTWAKDTDKQLGMSKQTTLDAAATFGVFGKAAGKSGQDLRSFAQQNTMLAADLASFHNSTPEEAIEALGAAFRGEAEPMRKFGVLLDDATLREEALRMGLVKTTKEALTPQQKTLAAQAVIMKQTKDAQGDFARTSGGLANQQRILKAQLENAATAIGTKLLPVATKIATWANTEGIPALKKFGAFLNDKLPPIFAKVQAVIRQFTSGSGGDISKFFADVKGIFTDGVTIVQRLWRLFGKNIMRHLRETFAAVKQILGGAFKVIKGLFQVVSGILTGDWKKTWKGIKNILSGAKNILIGLVKLLWSKMKFVFSNAGVVLKKVFGGIWDGIKSLARKGVGFVIDVVRSMPGKLAGLAVRLGSAGVRIGRSIANGIIGAINSGIRFINSILPNSIGIGKFSLNLPDNPFPTIPGVATGGKITRGGVALVGERGPELVSLPTGSRVHPNGRGPAGGGGDTYVFNLYGVLDGAEGAKRIEQILVKRARATGRPLAFPTAAT